MQNISKEIELRDIGRIENNLVVYPTASKDTLSLSFNEEGIVTKIYQKNTFKFDHFIFLQGSFV